MQMLCNRADALVFAVHTRLAPEHTYPAAHDDAQAATQAIMADVEQWHGDPARIVLAGDSAGGHLALITTLRLKEQGAPLPAATGCYTRLLPTGRSQPSDAPAHGTTLRLVAQPVTEDQLHPFSHAFIVAS